MIILNFLGESTRVIVDNGIKIAIKVAVLEEGRPGEKPYSHGTIFLIHFFDSLSIVRLECHCPGSSSSITCKIVSFLAKRNIIVFVYASLLLRKVATFYFLITEFTENYL